MARDERIDDLIVEHFSKAFEAACRAEGFEVLVSGADRHGTFVWEAGRTDTLSRFLTLGLTAVTNDLLEHQPYGVDHLSDARNRHNYALELSIVADDGQRFYRSIDFSQYVAWRDEPVGAWDGEHTLSGKALALLMTMAAKSLSGITEDQLDQQYVIPRPTSASGDVRAR